MYFTEGKGLGSLPGMQYYLREYDSIDEFLEYGRDNCDRTATSHAGFIGGYHTARTFGEAWNQAHDGWEAVRPKVDHHVEAIREKLRDMVTPHDVRVHDMIGYEPDIDRFVSGEIECMWDDMIVESPHAGKVFTVLLDNCISASQDADKMLKRGAAVIALIEAFQLFGFELEIWTETTLGSSRGKPARHSTLVRVQRAGDRPDINAIMFPLANPDWQRRLIFAAQEGEVDGIRAQFAFGGVHGSGYGVARQGCHFGERVDASIEISLERPDGAMVHDPVKWIVAQLQMQGVINDDED